MIRNRLSRNVTAILADALEPPPALLGAFDVIVSNPPYIPTGELRKLDHSVRDFEPVTALDGGPDGMDFYRKIIVSWPSMIKLGGFMAFECGEGQAEEIQELLAENGFYKLKTHLDNLGVERVVTGMVKPIDE
jgi:release factor glutamine methyltransferase